MTNSENILEAIIIGAGFGGLGIGASLKREGITDFLILEKGDAVGGIWRDNTYPGVACDVPPQLYSFSWRPDRTAIRFPDGGSTHAYQEQFATEENLREHLRLNCLTHELAYNDTAGNWTVKTTIMKGKKETKGPTYVARFVILAVGQLHWPNIPNLPGIKQFRGPAFHTNSWDHSIDLAGKNVTIIGTGPTATQVIPEVAKIAGKVTVYQRTPAWILPRLSADFGPITRWTFKRMPFIQDLYRRIIASSADFILSPIAVAGWSAKPAQFAAQQMLKYQIKDPELRKKLTPDYDIGCKRPPLSNTFYPALMRDNVELVTEPIDMVTKTSIKTADGTVRKTDVIVYATGFHTTSFFTRVKITGLGGRSLDDIWRQHGPEAYLGTAIADLPGLFVLHGPGAFTPSGSNVMIKEHQIHLIMNVIRLAKTWKGVSIAVLPEAMERYRQRRNKSIRGSNLLGCDSWYRDAQGRVLNPFVGSMRLFRQQTRRNPKQDFGPVALAKTE